MKDDNTSLSLDESHQIWEMIAVQVEEFINCWEENKSEPVLQDFLPPLSDQFRKLLLTELIKIDLEYRWSQENSSLRPWLVEDYLKDFPELAENGLPADLLYEEFHIRQRVGEEITPEEYAERFPDQQQELQNLLGVNGQQQSLSMRSSATPDHIEPGQTVDDFDLLTLLGKGAYGSVFLARQRSMQRLVALKVTVTQDDEPQTLAQMDHPNIVRVFDERVLPDQNLRLMYMQHIPGGTLRDALDHFKNLTPEERAGKYILKAVDEQLHHSGESAPIGSLSRETLNTADWPQAVSWMGIRLANALEHAHRLGVLHRDLKPANILLSAEGEPKLVDFNISFCSKLDGASPTAFFGGSIAYMSPEQLQAFHPTNSRQPDSLDGRSDVYALGIILWELLTGESPFQDVFLDTGWNATLDEMITRRNTGIDPSVVNHVSRKYPPELVHILVKCLEPDLSLRYQSASEVADDLRLCLNPDTQKILTPTQTGWRSLLQCFPLCSILLMTLIPNAIAGVFNYAYNAEYIINLLQDSKSVFDITQKCVNAVSYPLGVIVSLLLVLPVSKTIRSKVKNEPLQNQDQDQDQDKIRRRCLLQGHYLALVGIVGWLIAGFVYPMAMHLAEVEVKPGHYIHFMGSMAICGLIAAIYPFFFITHSSLRYYYPFLIRPRPSSGEDEITLAWIHRASWFYLALAATLPMLGIILMLSVENGDAELTHSRLTLGVLSAGGLLSFALVTWLARSIQKEVSTFSLVLNPADDSSMLSSSNIQWNRR